MQTPDKSFFARDDNLRSMRKFLTHLPLTPISEKSELGIGPHVEQLIRVISNNADDFDSHCQSNIEWIGKSFISEIENFEPQQESKNNSLASIFTSGYRFLLEYEFSQPNELSFDLRLIKGFVENNLLKFPERERQVLTYAHYIMPAQIVKNILYSTGLSNAKLFNENISKAIELKEEWDKEINNKQETVNKLKSSIDTLTESFNFVGLVDGFKNLRKEKTKEKHLAFASLMMLTIFVLTPVSSELIFVVINFDVIDAHRNALLYSLPALAALEFIFIYFFRIVLSHFRSVKAQILQLDLRMSLCQFIQSYASYSSKIKKDDPSALEKFENLVFSGILTNEEKIPSTFDGLEQIAKFIKNVKS